MKNLTLLLLLSLLFLLASCNKDGDGPDNPYGLPDATETGANTFGCLINGEPWIAEIDPSILDPTLRKLDINYDETGYGPSDVDNNMIVRSKLVTDSIHDLFLISVSHFEQASILSVSENYLEVKYASNHNLFNWYYLDESQSYLFEVSKLDTVQNICSGIFNFYLLSSDKSDTLHVTEGRFDKKYSPQ